MRSILKPVAFLLTVGVSLSAFSQVRPTNRITQAIDDRETVVLRGNVKPLVAAASDRGRMDGGTPLTISIAFRKTAAQEAALEKLLAEQQDPSSANYHNWLTPQQFADRFGMSAGDIASVSSWLQAQGFKIERVANSRTQLWFSGAVSKIETVFRTEMHLYEMKGEPHFANAEELSVPAALSNVVLGFHNLDDFRPRARVKTHQVIDASVKSNFTSSVSGNHFVIPGDAAMIYDFDGLYNNGFDGNGQQFVVVGQTAINTSDLDAFRSAASLPGRTSSNFTQVVVPSSGTSTVISADLGEASLDLEWSAAIAKGATQIFVYVGNSSNFSVFDSLQYAIDQNLAPVISISYGNCESALGSSSVQTISGWAQQANSQGQTITAASGDFGAADCEPSDTSLPATHGLAVDVPAAIPNVTGVGGTEFNGDGSAIPSGSCAPATSYWAQSCSTTSGASALSYIPETAWNDTTTVQPPSLSASGGGVSTIFSKPSWQTGTGVPNDGKRDVPDIALAASPNHDAYLLCSAGSCVSGFRDGNGNLNAAGGTSFGAPIFAGFVTVWNEAVASATGQGNVNPTLYSLHASHGADFHDITTGNNQVACSSGTPNCPTSGTLQYGYTAGTGYDLVTGLGTIDGNALVTTSPGYVTTPDFVLSKNASVSISAAGQSGTPTVTVSGYLGYSGTINLTCTPPASVFITCSFNPSSITLGGGTSTGNSTLTIKTNSTASLHRQDAPLAPFLAGGSAVVAGVFALGMRNRRRTLIVALILLMLAFVLASVACGGHSSSSGSGGGGGSVTPAGTYNVTVTGTNGSTTHATNVSVTVI